MSFVRKQLTLNSALPPRPAHQFKLCGRCSQSKPPEGGIDMSPAKWICAACWTRKAVVRRDK